MGDQDCNQRSSLNPRIAVADHRRDGSGWSTRSRLSVSTIVVAWNAKRRSARQARGGQPGGLARDHRGRLAQSLGDGQVAASPEPSCTITCGIAMPSFEPISIGFKANQVSCEWRIGTETKRRLFGFTIGQPQRIRPIVGAEAGTNHQAKAPHGREMARGGRHGATDMRGNCARGAWL